MSKPIQRNKTKESIHEVIFEADTPMGRTFDISLLVVISISVVIVMLESVDYIQVKYASLFFVLEWIFTIIFTIEYGLRLYSVYRPIKYMTSFFGVIDLLAILPAYLSLFFAGTHYFIVIRALRLIRIFRIFKLGHFLKEGAIITNALRASRAKIFVFLMSVTLLVIIIGAFMYVVEGGNNDSFSSIPRSIYWAIVTLTTVGYGDIVPRTELGQFFSAVVMILGYAIIAVPTGIVSAEMVNATSDMKNNTQACRYCGGEGHDDDAVHCKYCGEILNEDD
ncbi:MAG: ion transporter [Saprospiraceae bacterium]|nr:ion transporter [Saprospiraceae bacterium]